MTRISDGMALNPLLKFPRNIQCFCGKAEKAKRCCIPKLWRYMDAEDAELVERIWDGLIAGTDIIEFRIKPRQITAIPKIEDLPTSN